MVEEAPAVIQMCVTRTKLDTILLIGEKTIYFAGYIRRRMKTALMTKDFKFQTLHAIDSLIKT